MINITYKMILENTNTELEDNTGIQYSIQYLEIKRISAMSKLI